jgi:hypothetical protein
VSPPSGPAGRTSRRRSSCRAGRLPFDDLYSPKPSVARDARYVADTEYKTAVLGTEPPEIEVSLLSPAHARYYTHIRSVTLT